MRRAMEKVWKKCGSILLSVILPVLGSGLVRALAIYIFVSPNNFAPGGINGIAVLLEYIFGLNSGWFLFALNIPLFFLAFFLLGKREAVFSTLSMTVSSALLIVFDMIPGFPKYQTDSNAFLAAIAGGILLGLALAIMLKSCGTSGGTTILASLVNKKFHALNVSWLTFLFDAAVVTVSFFVYNPGASFTVKLDPVLVALVSLFVTSKVCDMVLQGFKIAYKFEIVTTNPEEISEEILTKLKHGGTMMPAIGMYSHESRSLLVCVIRKRQIADLQKIIKKFPDTFAYFSPTAEVIGKFLK